MMRMQPGRDAFLRVLKVARQEIVFITFGSAFHIRGAETEKVLSPYRLRETETK